MSLAVHGDLALLHHLQQRRLGLAGGAVDLVGQQQVGHDCAGLIDKAAALLMVHGETHDVRGQHIRRELDTPVLQTQRTAEGQCGGGLSGTGHVVQQHMAAGEHRHHDLFQHIVLTGDDLFHFMQDLFYAGIHLLFSSSHSL